MQGLLYQKIVLVVIDGLRPDAVTPARMPVLSALMTRAWRAESASTVRPSITVAALASLGTGVSPQRHGLRSAGIGSLTRLRGLRPLPTELRRLGVESMIVIPELLGGRVVPGVGGVGPAHLLDIPPTVLHGFGGTAPPQYEGRVIHEAYLTEYVWA